jgi:hypothetical protein
MQAEQRSIRFNVWCMVGLRICFYFFRNLPIRITPDFGGHLIKREGV